MGLFKMRFIVGMLTEEELENLRRGYPVISKLLLIPDDYKHFHYKEGDMIEAETHEGDRVWTVIQNLEVVEGEFRTIVILTLIRATSPKP